ncbi:MAG: hypothetical protein MUC56_09530 [Thermoanaerobaculales bacterium]|jgi:hypothetical protein|nr:hypothetical protein [Thermoanaerobaculales bacterium]
MTDLSDQPTMPFDDFWRWLVGHPNCIVRAGTPEAVLYDDEDLHWHFFEEEPGSLVIQVLRGKLLVGELLLAPELISYVQGMPGEREDEYIFELVTESENESYAAYYFVLVHGFGDDAEPGPASRVH